MPTYGLYLSTLVHEFSGIYVRKLSLLVNRNDIIMVLKFKEGNFSRYEEIISFSYKTFARSFEKVNNCFYFGMGSEIEDSDSWNQTELKKETGEILKVCK